MTTKTVTMVTMTVAEREVIALLDDIMPLTMTPDAEFIRHLAYVVASQGRMTPDGRKRLWSIAMYHLPNKGIYTADYAKRHLETLDKLRRLVDG